MGIQIGNVKVNGTTYSGGGIVQNGAQLKCPCGNTANWGDVTMTNGSVTADCGECGRTVRK
jgi:hypothetical protein